MNFWRPAPTLAINDVIFQLHLRASERRGERGSPRHGEAGRKQWLLAKVAFNKGAENPFTIVDIPK